MSKPPVYIENIHRPLLDFALDEKISGVVKLYNEKHVRKHENKALNLILGHFCTSVHDKMGP